MLTARFAEFVANFLAERTFYPLCHNGLRIFTTDASHAGGHWFESSSLHQEKTLETSASQQLMDGTYTPKRSAEAVRAQLQQIDPMLSEDMTVNLKYL